MSKRKIAVLGGGMGSLSALYWLTKKPDYQDRFEITVYQLGWRLGGKGASGRDESGRSLEHGYHVLLGFYENVFATMQDCYRELGRPMGSFREFAAPTVEEEAENPNFYAMHRHQSLQIAQPFRGEIHFLPFTLPFNHLMPGDGAEVNLWTALGLLFDVLLRAESGTLFDLKREEDSPASADTGLPAWLLDAIERFVSDGEASVDRFLSESSLLKIARHLWRKLTETQPIKDIRRKVELFIVDLVQAHLRRKWNAVRDDIDTDWISYRDWIVQDSIAINLCGILKDDVLSSGFDQLNHLNYLDWWLSHSAVPEGSRITAASSLGQFPFDLVFAYKNGDSLSPPGPGKPFRGSPNMEAGTLLRGLYRFLLTYKGAPEWLFQAGCGEVLAAPIYEVLRRRGVRFEFFHNVQSLHLDASKKNIEKIVLERQATPKTGSYAPLFSIGGLPCWPAEPLYDQLVEGDQLKQQSVDLESFWTNWKGPETEIVRGTDFDDVLIGISVGALPYISQELNVNQRWYDMVTHLGTNRPFIIQAWFNKTKEEMGWPWGVMNGEVGTQPVNLQTSMDQIIRFEPWPPAQVPKTLIYYSGVLPDDPLQPPPPKPAYPAAQSAVLREVAVDFLKQSARVYCPHAMQNGAFDWNVLTAPPAAVGDRRFDSQYWQLSINPSERYVLSLVDTSKYRMKAAGSGFDNVFLTGDWTDNGLNSGSMESAFTSGIEAAQAILGAFQGFAGAVSWRKPANRKATTGT